MSESEETICVDCGNNDSDNHVECESCDEYTCADCCVFVRENKIDVTICRQCYSKNK